MTRDDGQSPALTMVDLFSGAGGLTLGFKNAGFKTIWAADHNPAAVNTFRHNVDTIAECIEIDIDTTFPRPTVIVGGPPCQGFSSAGTRQSGDKRNTLVSVFASVVAKVRPEAFVFENVEGFLTTEGGKRLFELILPLIESGYCIHLRKINAANYGVPQLRKRVLAIGGLGFDPAFPEPSHSAFGAPGAQLAATNLPRTATVEDAFTFLPEPARQPPGYPSGHYSSSMDSDRLHKIMALQPGQTMKDLPEYYWHQSYRRRAYRRVRDGTPTERRGGAPAGVRRLRADEPSKAITAAASAEFVHPDEHRFLTLRECARLQTFPDAFVFLGTKVERALLIGNAVPPRLSEIIARELTRGLLSKESQAEKGQLLTFVPALSKGMSPALRSVVGMIYDHFRPTMTQRELF